MLRLRKTDGSTIDLNEGFRFVEVCDKDGKVAHVVYMDNSQQIISFNNTDQIHRDRYEKLFGVQFCETKKLALKSD
jgi:hypothetical protein